MRSDPVRDVSIDAAADPTAAGRVVVRLKNGGAMEPAARFRLKLVDGPAGDARWVEDDHIPVDVRVTSEWVSVTIDADLASHPLLAPGTAVLMEIGDVRGEFLWPAIVPVRQPKRKRVALHVVPPPTVVALEPASLTISAAMLDFERTSSTSIVDDTVIAAAAAPPALIRVEPPATPILAEPLRTDREDATLAEDFVVARPSAAPTLSTFRRLPEPSAGDDIPSIFMADEWPSQTSPPAIAAPVVAHPARSVADVFPGAATSDHLRAALTPSPTGLPPFATPAPENASPDSIGAQSKPGIAPPRRAPPTPTADVHAPTHDMMQTIAARLRRLPAMAAAVLGFGVLSAIAATTMLWPDRRGSTDARGVAFQDQRRWQDGQLQKPPAAKPIAAAEPVTKMAPTPPPVAAAPPPPAAPPQPPPAAASATAAACEAVAPKTTALPAGMMSLAVRSACHRQQTVTVSYGGLEFKRRFDPDGALDVAIDCIFGTSAPMTVTYADGRVVSVPVTCQDLERISKLAVIWRNPIDLDLQMFERPAAPGAVGQIGSATPGQRDAARATSITERAARGFLSSIGTAKSLDGADGVRMTVYTAFHPPQTTTQTIPFAIDYVTRGDTASNETCIGGRHANPGYEIVRLTARGQVVREDGQFAAFVCGAVVASTLRFNQSLHAPLRIRN